jgi:hypothetical protein
VRYSFNDVTTFTPPLLPQANVNGTRFYPGDNFGSGVTSFSGQAKERQQNVMASYDNVLAPNLLLELKASYLRSAIRSNPINYGNDVANALGTTCNSVSCINLPGNDVSTGLPSIWMPNGYGGFGDAGYLPLVTIDNSYLYTGAVDWTRGAHSLKFGLGLTRRQLATDQSAYARGDYSLVAPLEDTLADLIARSDVYCRPQFHAQFSWLPFLGAECIRAG